MELEKLDQKLQTQLTPILYTKLVEQLQKDFVLTGIEYDFSDLLPVELIHSLNEVMVDLQQKSGQLVKRLCSWILFVHI